MSRLVTLPQLRIVTRRELRTVTTLPNVTSPGERQAWAVAGWLLIALAGLVGLACCGFPVGYLLGG